MTDVVSISSAAISARISSLGAELVQFRDGNGADLLWDGDPAFWTGHAPLLFPVVGNTKSDRIRVSGAVYPMARHGFARTSRFSLLASEAASCTWRLEANDETRRRYPFEFRLEVTYRIDGGVLKMAADLTNRGAVAMPASFGFHPALRWPLPYGLPRAAHEIVFEHDETDPVRRLTGGLLSPVLHPNPVRNRVLLLDDDLFRDDALIFDRPKSRQLVFGNALRVSFPRMPQLGIWSKPGAGFVCIEPWQGYASPEDFDGELTEKPGMVLVRPGETTEFGMSIALEI